VIRTKITGIELIVVSTPLLTEKPRIG